MSLKQMERHAGLPNQHPGPKILRIKSNTLGKEGVEKNDDVAMVIR